MVSLVPGIAPSAGALAQVQTSFAPPETSLASGEALSLNDFLLELRTSLARLEALVAPSGVGGWGLGARSAPQIGAPPTLAGLPAPSVFTALTAGPAALSALTAGQAVPLLTSGQSGPLASYQAARQLYGARPPATSAAGGRVAQAATSLMGSRYLWGGHSPSGFDCTGFTWYVAKQAGIDIPQHDLAGQMASGRRVDRSDLQAGDLVFFQNTYQPGLSHVGLALGEGRFIHAASETQGVIISRLDEPYWAQRYVGATRVQSAEFRVQSSHPAAPSTQDAAPSTQSPAPSGAPS